MMKTGLWFLIASMFYVGAVFAKGEKGVNVWKQCVGKPGPSGWRVNVIQPDPEDDGPDGFNHHDWDGDGDLDVFVNFEEGGYSCLYFNPGKKELRDAEEWVQMILFENEARNPVVSDIDGDGLNDLIVGARAWYKQPVEN
ncbi:FG-GAP repeat domain-containing protein, partial [Petrachloros mirabilis]